MESIRFVMFLVFFVAEIFALPAVGRDEINKTPGWLSSAVLNLRNSSADNETVEGEGSAVPNTTHPFLRAKRDVNCPIPSYIPVEVLELNTFLNSTQYLGLTPQQPAYTPLPTQPSTCPAQSGSWWPGTELNLRSTCPWILTATDLGESFYPRYINEAKCLCTQCVNANAMNCEKVRQEITVFHRGACNNGLAVMTAVKRMITVACACAGIPVQTSGGAPVTE
ncbi:uncharacterized protein LOC131940240 [Physella acuta]|uniref:uncharacterized protein LOC131940240 n=1 Tax=Physella acuta TaxID=109671 RepID=UPI0027DBE6D1|nr:uncharacterized protein LOC131940240 [Physella acuta]